jgi:hypothetical protein
VGLFLPSYSATKVAYLRAIVADQKKILKQSEIRNMIIPKYEELSVKNLYSEARKDQLICSYLPDPEHCSTDFPERIFFFAILATLRTDYLTKIIKDAHAARFDQGKTDQEKDFILANDDWIHELTTHPFISSKILILILLERPGKAIYLMKQRSKLMRGKKESKKHPVKISITEWGSDHREEIKDGE